MIHRGTYFSKQKPLSVHKAGLSVRINGRALFCSQCGKELANGVLSCPICGAVVPEARSASFVPPGAQRPGPLPTPPTQMQPLAKGVLIGCGVLAGVAFIAFAGMSVWFFSGPVGGVKVGNEMDRYALDYIAEHGLLNPNEEILAYYDVTLILDGSEAAIVTDERVIYHKEGTTTSISMKEIEAVRHKEDTFIGDIIEIQAKSGRIMKIEIALFNQGETFRNVLMTTWEKHKNRASSN